jgi:hypothetical protein
LALSAEANAFNDGVDALMALWETYIETLTGGAHAVNQVVWIQSELGSGSNTKYGSDASQPYDNLPAGGGEKYPVIRLGATANIMPFEIGGKPLFFKLTNAAGDIL